MEPDNICDNCGGSGLETDFTDNGLFPVLVTCHKCGGSGFSYSKKFPIGLTVIIIGALLILLLIIKSL